MQLSDRIFGVIGIAVAVFFAWAASWIEDSFIVDPLGPRKFPYIIAAVLALASLAIILRPDAEPEWPALGPPAGILVAIVGFAAVGWVLPLIAGRLGIDAKQAATVTALLLLVAPVFAILGAAAFGPISPATELLVALGAMIAYALALPELGFLVATALSAAYLGWRLGSGPVAAMVSGVLIALSIYIVFHKVLGLSLAKGPVGPYVDAVVDPIGHAIVKAWTPVQALIDWVHGLFGGGGDAAASAAPKAGD